MRELRRSSLEPDLISHSASMGTFEHADQLRWESALHSLNQAGRQKPQLDLFSLGSAMTVCGKAGKWNLTLALLQQIAEMAIQASAVTYSIAAAACAHASNWRLGLALLGATATKAAGEASAL